MHLHSNGIDFSRISEKYISATTSVGKSQILMRDYTKEGYAMFGDDGKVVSRGKLAHALLRNESWLRLFCPDDWQVETEIRFRKNGEKKKIIPDVKCRDEEGVLHAIEVNRSQKMKMNEEKLKKYEEFTQIYRYKFQKLTNQIRTRKISLQ